MPSLVNPQMSVIFRGSSDMTLTDHYMDYDITKDLSEETNTARLSIYNLGPAERSFIENAENQEAPIEIYLTPSNSDNLVQAFRGEIITNDTEPTRPGHVTVIECETSKANHRAFHFDSNFEAGTPRNEIVRSLIDAVGLPTGVIMELPTSQIEFSETFSGPAFRLLEHYVYDMGGRAYITDGVLNVSSIYRAGNFSVFKITDEMLLDTPRKTTRIDEFRIAMRTVVESASVVPGLSREDRIKNKSKKTRTTDAYVEYDGVDKQINGVSILLKAQPVINPDQIITIPNEQGYFRVQSVTHTGNNEDFTEWDTYLQADEYKDTGGDLLAL